MLDSINTKTIEIVGFQPPQCISNKLLRSISNLPIDIRHVGGKLAIQTVLGPVTVRSPANATCIEPFRIVLIVRVLFMNVVHNKIHHDANVMVMCCFNQCMKFFFGTQFRLNSSWFRWPVTMEGRNIVDSICGFARSIRCRVKRRKP